MLLRGSLVAESGASRASVGRFAHGSGLQSASICNKLQYTRSNVTLPWNPRDAAHRGSFIAKSGASRAFALRFAQGFGLHAPMHSTESYVTVEAT